MAAFALALHRRHKGARLLVLSGSPDLARAAIESTEPDALPLTTIMRVPPDQVPRYLGAADIGLAYRLPTFASIGVAPVKLSEYLLCGLPVLGTARVGDTEAAVQAGCFFDDGGDSDAAAEWTNKIIMDRRQEMREKARGVGVLRFSLQRSVEDYLSALRGTDSMEGRTNV
jgi:glycosyltransferase involved in cell wall biosynthesis